MTKDAFKERERALEEEFFRRVDSKLLADLKEKLAAEDERKRLSAALGCDDESLVAEFVAVGVSAEAVTAMSLAPLVVVAWADGKLDAKERPAIFAAAKDQGITEESAAGKLLQHWLDSQPSPELAATWKHYVRAVSKHLSGKARRALRKEIVEGARDVAKASGGALGFGAVSESEQRVISDLDKVFDE